jgi:epoxyqueuosine reductase
MNIIQEAINRIIQEVFNSSHLNTFKRLGLPLEPMWQQPVIGYAAGNDDLFSFYRQDIGDFYWLPEDVFSKTFAGHQSVSNDDLTVLSIGFAQTTATKTDQASAQDLPSDRWLVTRGEWEAFICDFCSQVVSRMAAEGINAAAIDLNPDFRRESSEKYGLASNWSHRHTAYAAGLGTFGLSDGLITRQGKAMRFTSLVVEGNLPVAARPYRSHQAWCSFYANGTCGACMHRCPVNAITLEGHDKDLCAAYLERIKNELGPDLLKNSHYVAGCGLCQSRIPCQDSIPRDIES